MAHLAARLTPKENASQRTKNRIKEHGPVFSVLVRKDTPVAMGGAVCMLVKADDWHGWLPIDEIDGTLVDD